MDYTDLPTDVDDTYADRAADPSIKAHQQAHDAIHGKVRGLPAVVQDAATLDADTAALVPASSGSLLSAALSDAIEAGALTLAGHGFPEGVVTATPGYRYIDLDATNGAREWSKISGTGNTGWQVTVGDTGLRNVAADLTNVDSGGATVRRVGALVTLSINAVTTTGDTAVTLLPGMPGFVSATEQYAAGYGAGVWWVIPASGDIRRLGGTAHTRLAATTVYVTDDPWPTVLPGVPA